MWMVACHNLILAVRMIGYFLSGTKKGQRSETMQNKLRSEAMRTGTVQKNCLKLSYSGAEYALERSKN